MDTMESTFRLSQELGAVGNNRGPTAHFLRTSIGKAGRLVKTKGIQYAGHIYKV